MSRTRVFPSHSFDEMNTEEIATLVESDIKSLARKWKYAHGEMKSQRVPSYTAATETAALYLQANHALYFREDRQEMIDAHQRWIDLMRAWFLSVIEKNKKPRKAKTTRKEQESA